MKIKVSKEYEYITIGQFKKKNLEGEHVFKKGRTILDGYGTIRILESKVRTEPKLHQHIIDASKMPAGAVWRYRQEGDIFSPLNMGGTKKLKDYFIDKKVPQRMRDNIPVLAVGNRILLIADIEISDELKVTDDTVRFYKINYEKDLI